MTHGQGLSDVEVCDPHCVVKTKQTFSHVSTYCYYEFQVKLSDKEYYIGLPDGSFLSECDFRVSLETLPTLT